MFWPCETRTSTCRNFATISSGLYRFLVIAVLLDVKDIPQVGPLQWGRINVDLQVVAPGKKPVAKKKKLVAAVAGPAATAPMASAASTPAPMSAPALAPAPSALMEMAPSATNYPWSPR